MELIECKTYQSLQCIKMLLIVFYFYPQVKNGQWGRTVLEINTKRTKSLPVMDIGVYDVGAPDQDFKIKLGEVCFFN